jgi:hypothetical protein
MPSDKCDRIAGMTSIRGTQSRRIGQVSGGAWLLTHTPMGMLERIGGVVCTASPPISPRSTSNLTSGEIFGARLGVFRGKPDYDPRLAALEKPVLFVQMASASRDRVTQ